jgi:hypothetical protein
MKRSALTGIFTFAAMSLIATGSSLAAAEDNHGQAASQSGGYAQFGMTQPLDMAQLDRAFTERISAAVELQGVQVSNQAQSRAEARYQQYSSVDTLVAYPSGDAYQSVAIAQ